ncbi:MAG TPA: molybdopterin-binding protein [Xanthobacteraceae bacterium]|jgi:molybdopterin biosynthesis enzyme|nr:molybdopterin-binding protein [Xanthobacteraceae bacterium]
MPPEPSASQKIAKLTPLDGVFRRLDALATPVAARRIALARAEHLVLAEDVRLAAASPARAIALQDGHAVSSKDITDAGPYTPVAAKTAWIEAGEALPDGFDAVLAPDAVNESGEVMEPAAPGDNVWPQAADGEKGSLLSQAGEQLRAIDIAVLESLGVKEVSVRVPKIALVAIRQDRQPMLSLFSRMIAASGGEAANAASLDAALDDESADAVIVLGGSGMGRNDKSVTALAGKGRVEIHGFALKPGETAALGAVGGTRKPRPVLIVPGRFDAALAVFAVMGLRLIAKLSGRTRYIVQMPITLSRKLASQVGIAEFVPLARTGKNEAEPVATGTLPLSALARSDGWLMVPAESEGYPEGSRVEMRFLP